MESKKFTGITGSTLKIIAIISMLIDHIGAVIFERGLLNAEHILANPPLRQQLYTIDRILRLIGRPAFPIFCFLLVEGFFHTRNVKKYAFRLFLFAFISEIPFDLALRGTFFYIKYQNVFFTLLVGLLVMILADRYQENRWLQSLIFVAGLGAGYLLHSDYGYKGVLLIEILYFFRFDKKMQTLAGALSFSWEATAPLAFLPILAYNGKRGLQMRNFFYCFYPAHLLILTGISQYLRTHI